MSSTRFKMSFSNRELQKLSGLLKVLGPGAAYEEFAKWLKAAPPPPDEAVREPCAQAIGRVIMEVIRKRRLRIPRGGYLIRSVMGSVIVVRLKPSTAHRKKHSS